MEETIKKIIETDKKAKEIVSKAKQKAESFDVDIKKEIEELTLYYKSEAGKKISKIKTDEDKNLNKNIDDLYSEYQSNIEKQSKIFNLKKDVWIEEMFSAIINNRKI